MEVEKIRIQLKKAAIEYSILTLLSHGVSFASGINEKLRESNLLFKESSLYPILKRFNDENLLSFTWEESLKGPPGKRYFLTKKGKEVLKELEASWNEIINGLSTIQKN